MIRAITSSMCINEPMPAKNPSSHSITSMTTIAQNKSISNYPHFVKDNMANKLDAYMARHFEKMYFFYIMPKQSFSPVRYGLPETANPNGLMIVVSLMIIISGV